MNEVTTSFNIYIVVHKHDPEVGATMQSAFVFAVKTAGDFYAFVRERTDVNEFLARFTVVTAMFMVIVIAEHMIEQSTGLDQRAFYMGMLLTAVAIMVSPPIRPFFKPFAQLWRR